LPVPVFYPLQQQQCHPSLPEQYAILGLPGSPDFLCGDLAFLWYEDYLVQGIQKPVLCVLVHSVLFELLYVFIVYDRIYMGQAEIKIFIVLSAVIVLIFIAGIIMFVFQYRKRRVVHEEEKLVIEKQHKLELLNTQLETRQQTMQFIGSELHDSVAQKLTLASIYSQKLEFENPESPLINKLNAINHIINDSLGELRDLSKTLVSTSLQDTDLPQLLQQECDRINDTGLCKCSFICDFSFEISVTAKSFIFRVVQEFVQNSLKHSGCRSITIELIKNNDLLRLTLTDDGKGFEVENSNSMGIGLHNMKRRIKAIGGSFEMISTPNSFTMLNMIVPLSNIIN
jgi:signal transduction histidine kinase